MGFVSSHQAHQNAASPFCTICGTDLPGIANGSGASLCLLCRAAILNQMFQMRRQQGTAREDVKTARRHKFFPDMLPAS